MAHASTPQHQAAPQTSCSLTVLFEDPFWVGIAERQCGATYQVARHVFGAEPSIPEVQEFALADWRRLRFAQAKPDEAAATQHAKMSYKRMLREAKEEQSRTQVRGTAAQRTLQAQREQDAADRKAAAKERRDQAADAAYQLRKAKQRAKHRGH